MRLIPAQMSDAERLAKIHEECFVKYWDTSEFSDLLSAGGVTAWLCADGEDTGLLMCRNTHEQSEIITLAVRPRYRRRHIAEQLLAAGLENARKSGAQRMFLEVAEDNAPAVRLYEKSGFSIISRRKDYYRQPDGNFTDALVMVHEIA